MRIHKWIGSAVFLAFPALVFAQRFEEVKKEYPNDHAVMVNKISDYTISLRDNQPFVESEESAQIQFLTSDAAKYMSQYGFYQSEFQQVIEYEAYTRTSGDKKQKVVNFKTNDSKEDFVFYDDSKYTSFNFPFVDEGASGYFHLKRINKDPYLLTPFYFGSYMPVMHSEVRISCPKDMKIRYQVMGMDSARVVQTTEKKHGNLVYTFTFNKCPRLIRYNDAPSRAWLETQVVFYIDSYKNEQGQQISFLSNLDDLYKLSYGYLDSINRKPSPEIKRIVDSLTGRLTDPNEKAAKIYSWVQHNIKYIAFEQGMEGFIPRDANLVCSRRFGDCKDMSSILTVMEKAAGIQAYFTWIGTRDLPYKFSELPLPLVSNHMICTVLINGKYIFLDGTDPSCIYGFPSRDIQDKEAMIAVDRNNYKILNVPVIEKDQNKLTDSTWLELGQQGISGKLKRTLTGYYSINLRDKLIYVNQDDVKQEVKNMVSRGSNKFQLEDFKINTPENTATTTILADFRLPDYAKNFDNEIFVNLNLFKFYEHEEIDYPKRTMPIEQSYLYSTRYVTLLKIPAGYKVASIPAGKEYHNDVWGFNIKYEQKGDWLVLTQEFDNDWLQIAPKQFSAWNKVLENLFPLYKESLSFSKINTQ